MSKIEIMGEIKKTRFADAPLGCLFRLFNPGSSVYSKISNDSFKQIFPEKERNIPRTVRDPTAFIFVIRITG